MSKTEKTQITTGHGENLNEWRVWARRGAGLPPSLTLDQREDLCGEGGAVIMRAARRLAAREVYRLRWAACGGAGVAAGTETAADGSASVKFLDHADQSEFEGVFAAALRVALFTNDPQSAIMAGRAGGACLQGCGVCPSCDAERVRAAVRAARTECRSWIYSRGGVEGDGLGRVDLSRLDGSSGEGVILRPSPSWSSWGDGGRAALVFIPRSYWHGNANFPSLGWSRVIRVSSWEAELDILERRTAAAIAAASPNNQGRMRAAYGDLLSSFRAMVCGADYVSTFGAVFDDSPQGKRARAALSDRVENWKNAINGVDPLPVSRDSADGGLDPAHWIVERSARLSDEFARAFELHRAAWVTNTRRAIMRLDEARRRADDERAAAAGLLTADGARRADEARRDEARAAGLSVVEHRRRIMGMIRAGGHSADVWLDLARAVSSFGNDCTAAAAAARCRLAARAAALAALRAALAVLADARARRQSDAVAARARSARLRAVSLLQGLRAMGGAARIVADRAASGVDLSGVHDYEIEAADVDPIPSTAAALADVRAARNAELVARVVPVDYGARAARSAARARINAAAARAARINAALRCPWRAARARSGVIRMGARGLAFADVPQVVKAPRGGKRAAARAAAGADKRRARAALAAALADVRALLCDSLARAAAARAAAALWARAWLAALARVDKARAALAVIIERRARR